MNKKETITGISKQYEPILVYLISLLGLIFSFMKDEVDKEARWVYNQAGALFIVNASVGVVCSMSVIIPIVGILVGIIGWMVSVACLVFAIIAIIKAYNGEHYEIPVIANIAKAIWKYEDTPKSSAKKDTKTVKEVEVKAEKKTAKKTAKKED